VASKQPTAETRSGSKGISGRPPEAVRIKLLGSFSVSVGSRTIQHNEWRLRKAASLVKLLALAPGHRLHLHIPAAGHRAEIVGRYEQVRDTPIM
jgi:hypothetical protein